MVGGGPIRPGEEECSAALRWLRLNDRRLHELDALLQSSEVRRLMVEVRPSLARAGYDRVLTDDRQHLGESYLPVFINDVKRLLPEPCPHEYLTNEDGRGGFNWAGAGVWR